MSGPLFGVNVMSSLLCDYDRIFSGILGWPSYTFFIVCPMFFPYHFILTSVDCNLFVRSHGWYVMRHRGLFDPPFLSVV